MFQFGWTPPQTPGVSKLFGYGAGFIPGALRCQPASKNCFMTPFFHVNSAKTLIWSISLFWGILGGL